MRLIDAIEHWRKQPGAPANAYEWYRRDAKSRRKIHLGSISIAVNRNGRTWVVEDSDVKLALDKHSEEQAELDLITLEFESGILRKAGETVRFRGGGYTNHGEFRFQWGDHARLMQISDGCWICNGCGKAASAKHEKEECHRCRDWSPCGRDCTLSEIYCATCQTSMRM